jgi:hypothetical protein
MEYNRVSVFVPSEWMLYLIDEQDSVVRRAMQFGLGEMYCHLTCTCGEKGKVLFKFSDLINTFGEFISSPTGFIGSIVTCPHCSTSEWVGVPVGDVSAAFSELLFLRSKRN